MRDLLEQIASAMSVNGQNWTVVNDNTIGQDCIFIESVKPCKSHEGKLSFKLYLKKDSFESHHKHICYIKVREPKKMATSILRALGGEVGRLYSWYERELETAVAWAEDSNNLKELEQRVKLNPSLVKDMYIVFREVNSKHKDIHCAEVIDAGTFVGLPFIEIKRREGFVSNEDGFSESTTIRTLHKIGDRWAAEGKLDTMFEVEILVLPEILQHICL